ncbi:hypothetical protein M0805_003755 [Coniferiporia weirii]|nr:hypothetical protein M0805_003755 [Coniferiporia weirii]
MAPKIPSVIACNSVHLLDYELGHVRDGLNLEETEDSWDKIAQAVLRFSAIVHGSSASFPKELAATAKSLSRPIISALNSERSRLSGAVTELLSLLAASLRRSFDLLIPPFVPALLTLATRSSKIFVSRAKTCLLSIVEHVQTPALLPFLRMAVTDKSVSLRLVATDLVVACLNCYNPPDLETPARAEDIEAVIRTTARDASADVRKSSRKVFEAYKILLPSRLDTFVAPLTPTMKKYLDIKTRSTAPTVSTVPPARQKPNLLSASLNAVAPDPNKNAVNPRVQGHTRTVSNSSAGSSRTDRDERNGARERQAAADMPPPPPPPLTRAPSSGPVRPPPGMRHAVAPARSMPMHLSRPGFDPSRSQPNGLARGGAQRPTLAVAPASAPAVAAACVERPKSADLARPGVAAKFDATKSMQLPPAPAESKAPVQNGPRRVPKAPVSVPIPSLDQKQREPAESRVVEQDKMTVLPDKEREREKEKPRLKSSSSSADSAPTRAGGDARAGPSSRDERRSARSRAAPAFSMTTSSSTTGTNGDDAPRGFRPSSRTEARSHSGAQSSAAEAQSRARAKEKRNAEKEREKVATEKAARSSARETKDATKGKEKEAREGRAKRSQRNREPSQKPQEVGEKAPAIKTQAVVLTSAPDSEPAPQDPSTPTERRTRKSPVSASYPEPKPDLIRQPSSDSTPSTPTPITAVPDLRASGGAGGAQTASLPDLELVREPSLEVQTVEDALPTPEPTPPSAKRESTYASRAEVPATLTPPPDPQILTQPQLPEKEIIQAPVAPVARESRTRAPESRSTRHGVKPLAIRKTLKADPTDTGAESDEDNMPPTDVPLPESPGSDRTFLLPEPRQFCTPTPLRTAAARRHPAGVPPTPISALLFSIEHGFDASVIGEESAYRADDADADEDEMDMDLTPSGHFLAGLGVGVVRTQMEAQVEAESESGDEDEDEDSPDFFVDRRPRHVKAIVQHGDERMPLAQRDRNC